MTWINAVIAKAALFTPMLRDRTAKDLLLLTVVKVAVIALIYHFCFAAYDGQPADTVSHLLGPAGLTPQSGAPSQQGQ